MTLAEVMHELEAAGTEQTRSTYLRHGADAPLFGVSYAALDKLAKRIKQNQPLAEALWATGNHDARILATKIAAPAGGAAVESWLAQATNYIVADALAALTKTLPDAEAAAHRWMQSQAEWIASAGWNTLSGLLASGTGPDDSQCRELLYAIERGIGQAPNRVRHSMNGMLIAIGIYRPAVRAEAVAAARRIGRVNVDHGNTACKTPDAIASIEKAVARTKKAKA